MIVPSKAPKTTLPNDDQFPIILYRRIEDRRDR